MENSLKQREQGKYYNDDPKQSAQPCGCDPGARHFCHMHLQGVPGIDSSKFTHEPLKGIEDSGQRVTFSSGSMRDPSEGKIKWSRIHIGPMARRWAQHLTTAEAKYPDPEPGVANFSLIHTEEERIRYRESALRHFMSWYHGETNEDHASAVFFNVNGVEIIKAKQRGEKIDGIEYQKA